MTKATVRGSHLIIGYAVVLHLIWAGLLLYDSDAAGTTAIHIYRSWMPSPWIAVMFLGVATLATLATLAVRNYLLLIALMLPQQATLVISAFSALHAISLSQFGDGVVRPLAFIAADQLPTILLAVAHTTAILQIARDR